MKHFHLLIIAIALSVPLAAQEGLENAAVDETEIGTEAGQESTDYVPDEPTLGDVLVDEAPEAEEAAIAEEAPEAEQAAVAEAAPEPELQPAVRAPSGRAEVVNLSATIVGNQEQPTVLYIVPWKQAEDTTILYLPLSSKAMEHVFGHVERVEHQRQVQYIDQLDK